MDERDWQACWQQFTERTHTLGPSPGVREHWHRGRERWAVFLLRTRVPGRFTVMQEALAPWLAPFPAEHCHVTLWVAGFASDTPSLDDDVDDQLLTRICEGWSPRRPTLQVGAANSFATAAILEVLDPGGDLGALRQALTGLPEQRWEPYRPHVTVGTFHGDHPVEPVVARLTALREAAPEPLVCEALELVEISAQDPRRWRTRWQHRWS